MQPLPPPNRASSSSTGNQAREQQQSENIPPPHPPPAASAADTFAQGASVLPSQPDPKKKRKHRGGKRKKNRRQSFAAPSETSGIHSGNDAARDSLIQVPEHDVAMPRRTETVPAINSSFYAQARNFSDESLDSEVLLDHREQPAMRPRRDSRLLPSLFTNVARSPGRAAPVVQSPSVMGRPETGRRRPRSKQTYDSGDDDDEVGDPTDRTPLIRGPAVHKSSPKDAGYGLFRSHSHASSRSSTSRKGRRTKNTTGTSFPKFVDDGYDVNNPPSVPPSPDLAAHPDDVMVSNGDFLPRSPDSRRNLTAANKDTLIDIDGDATGNGDADSAPPSPRLRPDGLQRHRAMTLPAEGDVCFPGDEMSELAEDDLGRVRSTTNRPGRRRRQREWPQLWALDEWSREEREVRDGERRAKKTHEPVLVGGRLRPSKHYWHRDEEAAPYRFTYFCEEFESTIHSQTISELVQPGGSFRELFIPNPPELEDSSDSEDEAVTTQEPSGRFGVESGVLSPRSLQGSTTASRVTSVLADPAKSGPGSGSKDNSGRSSGQGTPLHRPGKAKKYGPRPTFWLDVLSPSDQEMRVLCKTFGIHALTSEDIMMQEAREKVELFRNYYFINYRTFEQDSSSEDYLEPVNMYVCVFHHGIVTFHFSQIPHPANVRRRIRQLTDYLILSADWISYAIIDDITDVYQPLITNIEEQVDEIDDLILNAYQETDELRTTIQDSSASAAKKLLDSSKSNADEEQPSGIDMLRRIGECRKKVMSLYRLLGQKADVIKGFAKRCNEQWEVAPKSEIGLYLGDIQDHIITMSSNLGHYETLLSRAHSNYLAQVNIRMNERSEKTADILGKLTVIGTIVLPMNIVCGMWGMNVKVPGQEIDNLYWFWSITAFLVLFAVSCFYWCKKVYKIV